jgi:hypothetical protein
MVIFSLLFAVQLGSVALAFVALRRLYAYIRRYRFDESSYTLLFGIVHLRYFAAWYIVMVSLAAGLELLYAFSLLTA